MVSGDSLLECAAISESCEKVIAVGINCTPPRFISGLILSIKKVYTLGFTCILINFLPFKFYISLSSMHLVLVGPLVVAFTNFFKFSFL